MCVCSGIAVDITLEKVVIVEVMPEKVVVVEVTLDECFSQGATRDG